MMPSLASRSSTGSESREHEHDREVDGTDGRDDLDTKEFGAHRNPKSASASVPAANTENAASAPTAAAAAALKRDFGIVPPSSSAAPTSASLNGNENAAASQEGFCWPPGAAGQHDALIRMLGGMLGSAMQRPRAAPIRSAAASGTAGESKTPTAPPNLGLPPRQPHVGDGNGDGAAVQPGTVQQATTSGGDEK